MSISASQPGLLACQLVSTAFGLSASQLKALKLKAKRAELLKAKRAELLKC